MAFQKKKKMFKRRGENGEEITVYAWKCDRCRIWFGDELPDDAWTCPYCRDKEAKKFPYARVVKPAGGHHA